MKTFPLNLTFSHQGRRDLLNTTHTAAGPGPPWDRGGYALPADPISAPGISPAGLALLAGVFQVRKCRLVHRVFTPNISVARTSS